MARNFSTNFRKPTFVTLEAGTYEALLESIEDCEVKKWQSEETEPGLKFVFTVDTFEPDGTHTSVKPRLQCRNIVEKRSKLVKTLSAMAGTIPDQVLFDNEAFGQLLEAQIGKVFFLRIEPSEGGYNNIKEILAPPKKGQPSKAMKVEPEKPVLKDLKKTAPVDDDMPDWMADVPEPSADEILAEVANQEADPDDIPF